MSGLRVVPVELAEANLLVAMWHRHHKPLPGHRFSVGVIDHTGQLHGAAITGRPVSRWYDPRRVAEVTRCVTDSTPNVCSMLYAAAARTARSMGFERIQTYVLDHESGISLLAAGWTYEGEAGGGDGWQSRPGRRDDQPTTLKGRWAKALNPARPDVLRLPTPDLDVPFDLFGETA